jgi:HD-like signal output (HDOD) protein
MPKVDRQTLINKAKELPSFSLSTFDLISALDNYETPRAEIIARISVDEILYANIFRFVNSAALGFMRRVDNIETALDVMGLYALKQLVLMLEAKKVFLARDLWPSNLFCGIAGVEFANRLDKSNKSIDTTYTSGLLSTFGLMVYKKFFADEYKTVTSIRNKYKQLDLEREIFGYDRFELSREILDEWGLPEEVVQTIGNQNKPNKHEYNDINAILELAEELRNIKDTKDIVEINAIQNQKKYTILNLSKLDINPQLLDNLHCKTQAILGL